MDAKVASDRRIPRAQGQPGFEASYQKVSAEAGVYHLQQHAKGKS
jgi:hypothetical protein